jgi:hypothetical protein
VGSCRLDLCSWGAQAKENFQRPYFEGHERRDVVEHRQQFIQYFPDRKGFYYIITNSDKLLWKLPTQTPPCILLYKRFTLYFLSSKSTRMFLLSLVDDESTFKSGEVSAKRWFFGEEAPFHSKKRGRSNVVSHFLVQYTSGPFSSVSESE